MTGTPELMRLAEAAGCVGSPRCFTAAIQQIAAGRRALVQRERVAVYHVLHLADATRSFFKLVCWGDSPPTLARDEHDGEEITLRVGDIVLFSACAIKSFRGNIEAQFTRQSSVQLLYRRDRFFNTRDVRLKDFYPMIEWYKQHRHEFLLATTTQPAHTHGFSESGAQDSRSATSDIASTRSAPEPASVSGIRDLREDMVANVYCTIQELPTGTATTARETTTTRNHLEFDGVLLKEAVMRDTAGDSMQLNLWDQYAEKRFVTRLLAHARVRPVEIHGLVISWNTVSNQLLANTTPQTAFPFLEEAVDAADLGLTTSAFESPIEADAKRTFLSIDAMENSLLEGRFTVANVTVERVELTVHLGRANHVEAQYTPLLVECYCAMCEQTLPVLDAQTIPSLYGVCTSHCLASRGQLEKKWRYRPVRVILRDVQGHADGAGGDEGGRLHAIATNAVVTQLVGNIRAELLIDPRENGSLLPFDVRVAVARLLNALVHRSSGSPQLFRADLERRCDGQPVHHNLGTDISGPSTRSSLGNSVWSTPEPSSTVYSLLSLTSLASLNL